MEPVLSNYFRIDIFRYLIIIAVDTAYILREMFQINLMLINSHFSGKSLKKNNETMNLLILLIREILSYMQKFCFQNDFEILVRCENILLFTNLMLWTISSWNYVQQFEKIM